MSNDETFAARWHRRKQEARKPGASPPPALPEQSGIVAKGAVGDDAAVAEDLPLPTLDDVTPQGDVIAFLHKRIPAELQKLALRKAWGTDPVISSFIEVAENQYDWNVPGGCPGYGPLDPSWDVEKLLAQATGALAPEDEVATRIETADVEMQQAGSCDIPTQGGNEPEELASEPDAAMQHTAHAEDNSNSAGRDESHSAELNSPLDQAPLSTSKCDTVEHTQRVAPHKKVTTHHRRHGGALPPV